MGHKSCVTKLEICNGVVWLGVVAGEMSEHEK